MSVAIDSGRATEFDKQKHDREFDATAPERGVEDEEFKADNKCAWTTCFTTA